METNQLVRFLQEDLLIPSDSIPLVLQSCEQTPNRLPVILWQHKLVKLSQLDQIFSWLEGYTAAARLSELN